MSFWWILVKGLTLKPVRAVQFIGRVLSEAKPLSMHRNYQLAPSGRQVHHQLTAAPMGLGRVT